MINNKIKKVKEILTIENSTSQNLLRKRNLFKENYIRTKSIDNKRSRVIESQNDKIIRSGIFDNINIKNHKSDKSNNLLGKNIHKLNNIGTKFNALIKVNVKMRKEKMKYSTNDYKRTLKKSGTSSNSINKKNSKRKNREKQNFNFIQQKRLNKNNNNNIINKIIFIQNFWKNYLLFHEDILDKPDYINYTKRAKARIFFSKIKNVILNNLLKVLKYNIYNIKYYFLFWYNKIYLRKIRKKIINTKNKNLSGNIMNHIIKKVPNHNKFKNKNSSSRQISSNFNKFKELNTYNNIFFSSVRNNSSSIDKDIKNNKNRNFFHKTAVSSLSNFNTIQRKSPMNNNQRNILIRGINNKKKKSSLTQLLRNNELDLNLIYKTRTPSNKNLKLFKYKNKFFGKNKSIEIVSNNKIPYFIFDKNKKNYKEFNNITLKTCLGKNRKILFNYINNQNTLSNQNSHKHEIKKHITLTNTSNPQAKNKNIKNKLYKLKKFDTCPQSFKDKKRSNNLKNKSKIKKYYNHWKSIIFKNKLIKCLLSKANKIKLRNIFFRKVIRIIMEHFQIIILKKYFDNYQTKSIKMNILFKLREYLLKNNKFKKYIDAYTLNKENTNFYSLNGGDIINNININNFINYNVFNNRIIPLQKTINNWNNQNQIDDFRLTFPYTKDDYMKLINKNNELGQNKNYKIIQMENSSSKGIIVDQINQLRMAFNLIHHNRLRKTNIKYYFNLWKNNALINHDNKANFRKISILQKNIKLNDTRKMKSNFNKICSERDNFHLNDTNNIIKSIFQNNIISKFINKENKNNNENSSELSTIKNQTNNKIIYTRKILKHKYNNNCNNDLKIAQGLRRVNKIEEMEIHFNTLSINKHNSFNGNAKLTESAIKNKISKIKIDLMDNQNHKGKKESNKIDYDNIFKTVKNSFNEKKRKINFKNVNQTFCCIIKNYQEEI